MRIGLDISQLVYSGTGVARYTEGLVRAILESDSPHQWVFLFSSLRRKLKPELIAKIKKRGIKLVSLKIPSTLLSLIWNNWHLGKVEWLTGPLDWFISSDWTEPPSARARKATVIHDLVFLKYPETVAWKILKTQQQRLIHVVAESDLVFADSSSTGADIQALLSIPKAKIRVVYPGVEIEKPTVLRIENTLSKYHLEKQKFILTVGKLEPRKNLERLIGAYTKLKTKFPLVVVGPRGWGNLNLDGQNVKTLGFVNDSELASLYTSCYFFVYPSLYEGFGYPLIEAATLGAATVVSNTSSLKELGSEMSLLFDPLEESAISAKMQELLDFPEKRAALIKLGKEKAREFKWSRALQQIIRALEEPQK